MDEDMGHEEFRKRLGAAENDRKWGSGWGNLGRFLVAVVVVQVAVGAVFLVYGGLVLLFTQ